MSTDPMITDYFVSVACIADSARPFQAWRFGRVIVIVCHVGTSNPGDGQPRGVSPPPGHFLRSLSLNYSASDQRSEHPDQRFKGQRGIGWQRGGISQIAGEDAGRLLARGGHVGDLAGAAVRRYPQILAAALSRSAGRA